MGYQESQMRRGSLAGSPLIQALPLRVQNCLVNEFTYSAYDVDEITPALVASLSYDKLRRIPNMGTGSLRALSLWLTEHGQPHDWAHRVVPAPLVINVPIKDPRLKKAADSLEAAARAFEEIGLPYAAKQARDLAVRVVKSVTRKDTLAKKREEEEKRRAGRPKAADIYAVASARRLKAVELRDQEKLTFKEIGTRLGTSAMRARQLYEQQKRRMARGEA